MHADVLGDSWLEFVLDPTKLDLHLSALKSGKATNPSGLVLIKTFVKQAEKPSSTSAQSKREKLLNGLAAKVCYTLGISLDDIEKSVPTKYQRHLLAEMVSSYNIPEVTSTLHRWVLRAVTHGVDPDMVGYDPEQSMQFLRNWLASVQPNSGDVGIKNQFLSANFDLGEYLLYGGDFASAESFLKKTHELHQSESYKECNGVINEGRLQGLLLATNLQNATNESPPNNKGPSKLVQTERACALPDYWSSLLNILQTDNAELPWMYRWNLDSHTSQHIPPLLASQIRSLNAIRHGTQGDLGLVPNWQQKLDLADKTASDFFFQACAAAAAANAGEVNGKLSRRMGVLARRVCRMVDTVQVWDSFLETASPHIEVYTSDLLSRQSLSRRNLGSSRARDAIAQSGQSQKGDGGYLQKVVQYAINQNNQTNLNNNHIQNQTHQTNQNSNASSKGAYGVLMNDITLYMQQHLPQTQQYHPHVQQPPPPLHQEAFAAILDKIQKCLALGPPDAITLQRIIAFLVDMAQWSTLQKISTDTKQRLEESNQHNNSSSNSSSSNSESVALCELSIGIAEIMIVVSTLTETPGQAQMAHRSLDPPLNRHFPIFLSYSGVLYTLLGELRSPTFPAALACVCVGLLYTLQKSKPPIPAPAAGGPATPNTPNPPPIPTNVPNTELSLDRYGIVAEVVSMCKCKSISISTLDVQLLDMQQQILVRLQSISPSHVWLAAFADSLFEQSRFREAIHFYLLSISIESSWFVGHKLGIHTYGMLGRLVGSLISFKATLPAVALLQLIPNGYAIASRLIQEDPYSLDPSYFQYIWEVPFLELLVFVYSRTKDDKKTNYLTQLLGVPELNEYNPVEMRQAFIHHIKLNLFRALCIDFLT